MSKKVKSAMLIGIVPTASLGGTGVELTVLVVRELDTRDAVVMVLRILAIRNGAMTAGKTYEIMVDVILDVLVLDVWVTLVVVVEEAAAAVEEAEAAAAAEAEATDAAEAEATDASEELAWAAE